MNGTRVRDAVDQLLETLDRDPTQLPVSSLAALHDTGHDVAIERRPGAAVVFVTPRPALVLDSCSRREREVTMLAVSGLSNQQIALALGITLGTVKDHMHAILRKTGLASRAQLIAAWYGGLPSDLRPDGSSDPGAPARRGHPDVGLPGE